MVFYIGGNKIKDTGEYGVYLGSQNTNCLTYTPKNINLTLDPLNVNLVGSPTINNGVASGFTASSWLRLPKIFNPSSNAWEMVIKARTPSAFSKRNWLTGGGNAAGKDFDFVSVGLENNGKPLMYITSNGTSWDIANGVAGSNTLAVNTDYLFRCQFTGTQYIYSTSVDNGSTWITQITINSTTKIFVPTTAQAIGTTCYQANAPEFWTGSIDLPNSYIKINGSTWWKGGTGALTLKKGSKVYVPNGKNADGSNKFDEVVIESDLSTRYTYAPSTNSPCVLFVNKSGTGFTSFSLLTACVSGTTRPSGNHINWPLNWYDTNNNIIETIADSTTLETGLSLPFAIITQGSDGNTISIDQTFDWCGYIGSTVFVLPGVKGLIPNGWNSDGTYKNIEFETGGVLTYNYTGTDSSSRYTTLNANSYNIPPKTLYEYDKTNNLNLFDGSKASDMISGELTLSSGVITSLTPYTAQPLTTVIPIKEIYNDSQLLYQYQTFTPGTVFIEAANTGTKVYTLGKGVYKVALCGARGKDVTTVAGGYAWGNAGSGGGFVEVLFYVSEKTTVTLYSTSQGNGASYMNFGSTRMITANGGADGAGAAGTCSVSSSLDVVETIKNVTGNQGTTGLASTPSVATVSTYGNWGSTANPSGGVRLEYIRINR